MYGVVDFRKKHESSTEGYVNLLALSNQLLGQPLLFVRRSYPDELNLHFGTPLEIPAPKGKTLVRGSYILGTVASTWTFKIASLGLALYSTDSTSSVGSPTAFETLNEETLDTHLSKMGGQTVTGVKIVAQPFGYALWVELSDSSVFSIIPTATEEPLSEESSEIPDWELFTPYRHYLRVGPGSKWAYLPSDETE